MRVRELTASERQALRRGLQAADGFTVRRCQVLLASADGAGPAAIGAVVGRSAQAVRDAIRAFHADGLGCLTRKLPVAKAPALVWNRARRRPEGPAPPPPPGVRQAHQPVDPRPWRPRCATPWGGRPGG